MKEAHPTTNEATDIFKRAATKPGQLPIVKICGKEYYDDKRLTEYRSVSNGKQPIHFVPYDDTVICPHCKAILTELTVKARYSVADKTEKQGTQPTFNCSACDKEIDYSIIEEWGIV